MNSTNYLAEKIVKHIGETQFHYCPRRGIPSKSKSWTERLNNYRWGCGNSPFEDSERLKHLENILGNASKIRLNGRSWNADESVEIVQATHDLFKWGRVGKGRGHNPPSIKDIEAVMLTAASYKNQYQAPLDSTWTKLAAISTVWMEGGDSIPQVIFDSRVSVALLDSIDSVCVAEPDLGLIREFLRANGLGYVTGRGGNRIARVAVLRGAGWKSGYRKWDAQFLASKLVSEMVSTLNSQNNYGRMPTPDGVPIAWTTRGVEMVLFMDGY